MLTYLPGPTLTHGSNTQLMYRFIFSLCALLSTSALTFANNVKISNVQYAASNITFDISWENSWRGPGSNPQFHDAVWVFVKVSPNGSQQWNHVTLDVTSEGELDVITPTDQMGAFIRRSGEGNGFVFGTVSFDMNGNLGLYPDIKVFAIEMVYVPTGPFYLGDGSSPNRYHVGNDTTASYLVGDSDVMAYGTGSNNIFSSAQFVSSDYPATFPNGYNAFYCMKYEVSQSQYAEFLNCLTLPQQESRTETEISGMGFVNTYVMTNTSTVLFRNAVRCIPPDDGSPLYFFCDLDGDTVPNESNDGIEIAMNYMSYDDLKAYLDWAALRPMSLMQYEKASRGPLSAVPGEYVWGTPTGTVGDVIINPGEASETFSNVGSSGLYAPGANKITRCGFAANSTSTRLTAGASYYGILELTGNIDERVCTDVSQELETEFGDGTLTSSGFSDNFGSAFIGKGQASTVSVSSVSVLPFMSITNGVARATSSGGRGVR